MDKLERLEATSWLIVALLLALLVMLQSHVGSPAQYCPEGQRMTWESRKSVQGDDVGTVYSWPVCIEAGR